MSVLAAILRMGSIYNALGATPDRAVPDALMMMEEAGCETAPA
jgi:hypothetical protein